MPFTRRRLAHRLEYSAVLAARGLTGALPARLRDALAAGLGSSAFGALRIRRDVAEDQIRQAFPSMEPDAVASLAHAAYRHLAREALVMLRLGELDAETIRRRTRVHGWDDFAAAVDAGRGVVIATGHFGNWEMGGAAMAVRGIPLDVVAQRQSNPLVDREIVDMRERLGMRVIDRRDAPRRVTRSLRQGRAVAFVADQDAHRSGLFVPFFGRPASTHRGPALFALRSGAPIFLGFAVRAGDGDYEVCFRRIEADRSGPPDQAIARMTAAFTAALEAEIRRAPEQYFWLHRRWKTRPR